MREPLDIRLDYINKFKDQEKACLAMEEFRQKFIEIDRGLKELATGMEDGAFQRAIALARTHNESACQATIKSLCLLWEDKTVPDTQAA